MNRVALREPIQRTTRSNALVYIDRGAQVEIVKRGTTERVNVYSAETGGSVLSQPLVTDITGVPVESDTEKAAWIAAGSYDFLVGVPPAEGAEDSRERFAEELVSGTIGADLESLLGNSDAVVFKGVKDCSANPNYPAADAGYLYKVSVAGKIGGASGVSVEVGDSLLCLVDGSAAGTQAGVGANWAVLQANVGIDTDSTFAANSDGLVPSQKAVKSALDKVTQGQDWSDGEQRSPYTADNPNPKKLAIKHGSAAAPSVNYGPTASISRVLNIPESAFTGAGESGLAALRVTAAALEGSEGQAVGGSFGAVTESSHEGEHSLADALALSAVGVSRKGSRTGLGLSVGGRRETAEGRTTAIEAFSDNQTEAGEEYKGTLPGTKVIHVHAFGKANSAVGVVFGKPSTAALHTGLGAISGSITDAFIRDDSGAKWGVLLMSAHAKAALATAAGAGPVVLGKEEINFAGEQIFEIYYGESALDPGFVFGTGKGKSISGILMRNSTGQMKVFAANAANAFLTGTAQGDVGVSCTPGKTLHFGAQTKSSVLRVNETGVGLNGAAPVGKAAAIAEPAETLAGHQAAIKSLREVVKNLGATA